MTKPTTIGDLAGIEVEHLVSERTEEPLVLLRALSTGTVLIGQLPVDDARQIAEHLLEAAARAEYEVDLITGIREKATAANMPDPELMVAFACTAVRRGEMRRHTTTGDNPT